MDASILLVPIHLCSTTMLSKHFLHRIGYESSNLIFLADAKHYSRREYCYTVIRVESKKFMLLIYSQTTKQRITLKIKLIG